MAISPALEGTYEPPPADECEEWTQREFLAAGQLLTIRRVFLRGRSTVVYFSVNQSIKVEGAWREVARIDCSHGKIHRHQFTQTGGETVQDLEVIPADHGEEVVERWCDPATYMMQNEWNDNVRRWNGDNE